MSKPSLQLKGLSFGRLTVTDKDESRASYWTCICECGQRHTVRGTYLVRGITKSCGCIRTIHGHGGRNRTPTYISWSEMKARCKRNPAYADVTYDPRWKDFRNFRQDMGLRP